MRSHREVIIDLSVQMAEEHPERMHEQQIYRTYPALITHILAADGRYGALNEAKLDAHGAKDAPIFRHDRFSRSAHLTLPLGEGGVALRDVMPRKVVSVPPSHF